MAYDNTDILFASLVGSKISIPRFTVVQNELMKHVLPPIPFLPLKNTVEIANVNARVEENLRMADLPLSAEAQFFPFYFVGDDGIKYMLPYEPMISITGKNNIVKRNVAKTSINSTFVGSIKERWNQADWEITITGVLIGSILTGSVSDCYPKEDFEKLKSFMTAKKELRVYCEPLQLLGIEKIVIEDFSFPFTKGENVQAYEIKAYSDFDYKLLTEDK